MAAAAMLGAGCGASQPHSTASSGRRAAPQAARLAISRVLGASDKRFQVTRDHGRLSSRAGGVAAGFSHTGALVRAGGIAWRLPANGAVRTDANRVSYRAGPIEEWFAAGPLGLEQGYTLARPPAGRAPLATLPVGPLPSGVTVRLSASARDATLLHSGRAVLRYTGLAAHDSTGRSLPAAIERAGGRLAIRVAVRGARYPVTVDPLLQAAQLTSGDTGGGLGGGGVAISGNTIVAGASEYPNGSKDGAVYVFVEPSGGWANMTTYTARLTNGNTSADNLGQSVAIDGNTIVAGAHGNGYADVFVEPGGGWASTAKPTAVLSDASIGGNTGFGGAVAISGDTIAVGDDADSGADGLIDVYVRPAAGWSEGGSSTAAITTPTVKLTDSTFSGGSAIEGELGASVAISGATIVGGAPTWRANNTGASQTGAALVFVEPAGGWASGGTAQHQVAILTPSATSFTNDPSLGGAVAIDGGTIVAGARNWQDANSADTGAAYVYEEPSQGWASATQTAVLTPSDGIALGEFGNSVGVSGANVAAGAPDAGNSDTGAAYVFHEPSGGWANATETQKLTAAGAGTDASFGSAVAIDGATVAGAAPEGDGSVYVFGDQPTSITTSALPSGTVGAAYSTTLAGSGGTTPYTWGAAGLSPGLSLDAGSGAITGTPTSAGNYTVSLTLTDAYGRSTETQLGLTVKGAGTTSTGISTTTAGATTPPTVRSAPQVTPSNPQAGQTLTCNGGTFSPLGSPSFVEVTWFQKVRSVIAGVYHVSQVGTGRSYTVPDDTAGTLIYCEVQATASNGGSATTDSGTVAVAASRPVLATSAMLLSHGDPAPSIDPTIGTGGFNFCTSGAWQHHPGSYSYRWYVVPSPTAPVSSGTPLSNDQGLVIGTAAEGGYLVCQVTATNTAGSTTALSNRYFVLEPDLGFAIHAMEITQGIQTPELPTRVGLGEHVAYQGVALPWSNGAPIKVKLAAEHATVIRVYVTSTEPIGNNPTPAMVLSASRDGESLGSMGPDQQPGADAIPLAPFTATLAAQQRAKATGAYTFTIPPDWTHGDVTFTATLAKLPGALICGIACAERRTLTLGPEHFNQTTVVSIDQLAFVVPTGHGPCPGTGCVAPSSFPGIDPIWARAQAVTAMPIQVNPRGVALDGGGVVNATSETEGFPCLTDCTHSAVGDQTDSKRPFFHWQVGQLLPMVVSWGDNNDDNSAFFPFALTPSAYVSCCLAAGVTAGATYNADDNLLGSTQRELYGDAQPDAFSPDIGPVTAIAHELHHGLGYKHDDIGTCGGDKDYNGGSENWTWPPDNQGELDGIGLDTSSATPYRIIPSPATTPGAAQVWDLMSYCPTSGFSEQNHWIAVRNWNRDVEFYAPQPTFGIRRARRAALAHATRAAGARPTATSAASSLGVTAVLEVGVPGALNFTVTPGKGAPTAWSAGDEYQLIGLDGAGQAVAKAGATGTLLHIDGSVPDLLVTGRLPAAGVRAVRVMEGGREVSEIHASPHAPTVTIRSPRARTTVGGRRGVVIRWRSHDADGGQLTATVDYSANGGRHWHTVYMGVDHGRALLPSGFLSASRRARLRISVSDGFTMTTVTSRPFRARGAPPTVSLISPATSARLMAGAALTLRGAAFDDADHRLTGRSLVWRAGRKVIAKGATTAVMTLPAGRHRVTLSARDRRGRVTVSAPVEVTVLPAPPVVRKLHAPRRVSRRAKRAVLRMALLTPARVTIGRHHWAVGRRLRALKVQIKPGRKPLVLIVRLRSGPYKAALPVLISRR